MQGVIFDRGMSEEEVDSLLKAPMPDLERAFYRAIYETTYRVNELLMRDIEDYDKENWRTHCSTHQE